MSLRREGSELANCQGTQVVEQREEWVESSELGGDFMSSLDKYHFCSRGLSFMLGLLYGAVVD